VCVGEIEFFGTRRIESLPVKPFSQPLGTWSSRLVLQEKPPSGSGAFFIPVEIGDIVHETPDLPLRRNTLLNPGGNCLSALEI